MRSVLSGALGLILVLCGCAKSEVEQAIESDANGFICRNCSAKFYTEKRVFALHCPQCMSTEVDEVVAFVCPDDQQVTLEARGPSAVPCSKCGKLVRELKLPRENELKAWGASFQPEEKVTAQ